MGRPKALIDQQLLADDSALLELDDDKVNDMKGKFQSSMSQYTGYISNINLRVLKDLGI